MKPTKIVAKDEWLTARQALLAEEKAFTKTRDALSAKRQQLPWVQIEKDYRFQSDDGEIGFGDLFGDNDQLLIYHFMYGPDWKEGCPSCSFWADNFNGTDVHLRAAGVALAAISNTSIKMINAYKSRMGWSFPWVSSMGGEFNRDFDVSFSEQEIERGEKVYNFGTLGFPSTEGPGISVFAKDDNGKVYHTYSTYARGLDMLNGAYHMIDLTPKGRASEKEHGNMHWLKRRDQYGG
ncbi:MAG: DUF899 family protein [Marinicaulis sp.]|nr:DUF899 family protein [Marinicaulis sp.]